MRNRIDVIAPPYVPDTYIAVNRISAGSTPILYVNGSASTTPITSVKPGSTATSMPSTRPITITAKFSGVKMLIRPCSRLTRTSMATCALNAGQSEQQYGQMLERADAQRQRDIRDAHEDHQQHERAEHADQHHWHRTAVAAD